MTLVRIYLSVCLAVALCAAARADVIASLGTAVTENFDALASSGTQATPLPHQWVFSEVGSSADGKYKAEKGNDNGNNNAGGVYSYGMNSASDRAFGFLSSISFVGMIGSPYTNSTGQTIQSVTISYTGEQWHNGGANDSVSQKVDFQYSLNATGLSNGIWTDIDSLDMLSLHDLGPAAMLDGNAAANRASYSNTFSVLVSPGAILWIRFVDSYSGTKGDGLGVDDFSIAASVIPVPETNAFWFGAITVSFVGLMVGTRSAWRRGRERSRA